MGQFVEGLPEHGIWDAAGLKRGQFLSILLFSLVAFVWLDGPLWSHLRGNHFVRLIGSYGIILPLAAAALAHNQRLDLGRWLAAVLLLSAVKLLLTAVLVIVIAFARA